MNKYSRITLSLLSGFVVVFLVILVLSYIFGDGLVHFDKIFMRCDTVYSGLELMARIKCEVSPYQVTAWTAIYISASTLTYWLLGGYKKKKA